MTLPSHGPILLLLPIRVTQLSNGIFPRSTLCTMRRLVWVLEALEPFISERNWFGLVCFFLVLGFVSCLVIFFFWHFGFFFFFLSLASLLSSRSFSFSILNFFLVLGFVSCLIQKFFYCNRFAKQFSSVITK